MELICYVNKLLLTVISFVVFKSVGCTDNSLGLIEQDCQVQSDGRNGICINLEKDVVHCPTLQKTLLEKNFTEIYNNVCGELNLEKLNETQVCCAIDEYIELYDKIVDYAYEKHENFGLIPNLETSQCGRSFSSSTDRIIGGDTVPPGVHPWMVRLGSVFPDNDDEVRFHCAGSILNERYILTAAHCLKDGELRTIRLAETDEEIDEECIMIGLNQTICEKLQDHEPEELLIHESYTGKVGSTGDIALIRLKEPIKNITSPFTRPICLPFTEEFGLQDLENSAIASTGPKNLATVQGWGKDENDKTVGTTQLKEVYVPLRSNVFCRQKFRKEAQLVVTDEQLCAGGTKSKGSCAGDSGAPLIIGRVPSPSNKRMGMRSFQIGIVSYGRQQCGLEGSPVVYTRVTKFLKWILDNIRD